MRSLRLVLTSRHFLVFILVSYAVVVSLFVDAGLRNYLVLIAAMIGGSLFPLLGLSLQRTSFWAFVLFSLMTMSSLTRGAEGQMASVALTFVYAIGYLAIASLLDRLEDKRAFLLKVLRGVIYAFAVLSAVQMVTSLTGLPVPNSMASKGLWSYNSLAYEPSQLGRILGISMLGYVMLYRLAGEPERPRARLNLLIAFLASMLLSGSALAVVATLMVYGLSRSLVWITLIAMASMLMWPMFFLIDFEPFHRIVLLTSSLGTLDVDQVLEADHSGGLRLAPMLVYLRDFSMAEPGYWLGYGTDGIVDFFLGKIPGIEDDAVGAGFLPGFAIVYGVPIFCLFVWTFTLRQINRTTVPMVVFWSIFMTSSGWNTQVFWYGLIIIQVSWAASREISMPSGGTLR